jgi:N-acetylglucosamine-6-phosphate deacetylase
MKVVDIHTHGMGGVDTRTADPGDILRLAEIHGAAGTDIILPTIYSGPIEAMRANLLAVREAMGRQSDEFGAASSESGERTGTVTGRSGERGLASIDSRITAHGLSASHPLPITHYPLQPFHESRLFTHYTLPVTHYSPRPRPARILGTYLEGPFLNPLRAGALDDSSFLAPSAYDLDRLLDSFEDVVTIVAIAPELAGALSLIRTMADRGIIPSMGHSDATFAEAEAGFHAGAQGITHLFNAMRGFHHREPGLAGFGLLNPHVYVEVIADPFHLHDETLRLIFSAKNRDRIMIISDSVKGTATAQAEEAISDTQGRLRGGSFSLRQSSKRLLELGYDEGLVNGVTFLNQHRYLGLRG